MADIPGKRGEGGKPAQRTPRVNRPSHSVTQFSLSVSSASSTASSFSPVSRDYRLR